MKVFNPDLLVNIIFPHLFYNTSIGVVVAVVVGTTVGLILRAMRRQVQQTLVPAVAGALIGSLVSLLPIYATPGIIGGGPYSGIYILPFLFFVLPVGAIGGAILLPTLTANRPKAQQRKIIAVALGAVYLAMIVIMFVTFSWTCSRPNMLPITCEAAGYLQ